METKNSIIMAAFIHKTLYKMSYVGTGITAKKIKTKYFNKVLKDIFGSKNIASDIIGSKSAAEAEWVITNICPINSFLKLISTPQAKKAFITSVMLVEDLEALYNDLDKKKHKRADLKKNIEFLKETYSRYIKKTRNTLGLKKDSLKTKYGDLRSYTKTSRVPFYDDYEDAYDYALNSASYYGDSDSYDDDDDDDEDFESFMRNFRSSSKKKSSTVGAKKRKLSYFDDDDDDELIPRSKFAKRLEEDYDEDDDDEDDENELNEELEEMRSTLDTLACAVSDLVKANAVKAKEPVNKPRQSQTTRPVGEKDAIDKKLSFLDQNICRIAEATKTNDSNIKVIAENVVQMHETLMNVVDAIAGDDDDDDFEDDDFSPSDIVRPSSTWTSVSNDQNVHQCDCGCSEELLNENVIDQMLVNSIVPPKGNLVINENPPSLVTTKSAFTATQATTTVEAPTPQPPTPSAQWADEEEE